MGRSVAFASPVAVDLISSVSLARTTLAGRTVAFDVSVEVEAVTSVWLTRTSPAGPTIAFVARDAVALTSGAGLATMSSVARSVAVDVALAEDVAVPVVTVDVRAGVSLVRTTRAGRTVALAVRDTVALTSGRWTSNDVFSCAFGRR